MSGNAYGNQWKYIVTRSKKAFKASTYSETLTPIPNNQNNPYIFKILKICKKIKII